MTPQDGVSLIQRVYDSAVCVLVKGLLHELSRVPLRPTRERQPGKSLIVGGLKDNDHVVRTHRHILGDDLRAMVLASRLKAVKTVPRVLRGLESLPSSS